MATIDIYNLSGAKAGTMELADEVFGAVNEDLLWEAITHYRASARAGTHATKNRWRVSGSGKKLWKQKGTGRARIGSIRSPLWRHGGTVHGPRPRDYSYALPKKILLGALRSALSAKLAEEKLTVVDGWQLESHKTSGLVSALDKLSFTKSALLVSHGENRNLELASRNIESVKLVAPNALQPYDVLKHDRLVLSKDAVARLIRSLDPENKPIEAPHVETIAPAPAAKKEAAPKAEAKKPAAKKAAKPAAKKKGKG